MYTFYDISPFYKNGLTVLYASCVYLEITVTAVKCMEDEYIVFSTPPMHIDKLSCFGVCAFIYMYVYIDQSRWMLYNLNILAATCIFQERANKAIQICIALLCS